MLESLSNKVADTPTHRYFPVNIEKFLRIPILKNICKQLVVERERKKVRESMRERESMGIGLNNSEEP